MAPTRLKRRRWRAGMGRAIGSLAIFLCVARPAMAQITSEFLSRTSPRTPFDVPEPAKYNLKWGNMKARIFASVQTELNDNINLSSQHREFDMSVGPEARIGFVWPINQAQLMEFNLALGYRWYFQHPALDTYNIRPGSRLDYKISIEDVKIVLFNSFTLQTDPTTRPELSGTNQQAVINYRRFTETVGAIAQWQPTTDLALSAGYDYTFDRSLSSQFTFLDRDGQTFNASATYALTPRWRLGVTGFYAIDTYQASVQNDANRYAITPTVFYQPTPFTTLNVSFGYSDATFRRNGTIADTSEFSGLTYSGGIRHVINQRASHSLQFNKSANLGIGSNFSDTFTAQYAFNWRLSQPLLLNLTAAYDHFKASGVNGESADRFLAFAGTTLTLSKRWALALGYAFANKSSNHAANDYLQNRVTLDLSRQF